MFVLTDANARTGEKMEGCDGREVLGAYGRDELNDNDERLLNFAIKATSSLSRTRFLTLGRVEYLIRSTVSAAAIAKNV